MAIYGLFSNCRKKPYKAPMTVPIMGGPGDFRFGNVAVNKNGRLLGMITSSTSTTPAAIASGAFHAYAALAGDTIATTAIAGAGTDLGSATFIKWEYYTTHGIAGVWASPNGALLRLNPVGAGSTTSKDFVMACKASGAQSLSVTVTSAFDTGSVSVTLYVNGTSVGTQSATINGASITFTVTPSNSYALDKLTVSVFTASALNSTNVNTGTYASYPVIIDPSAGGASWVACYAGYDTVDWDASDYSGAKYRTMTSITYGTGQAELRHRITDAGFGLLVATGTHHAEIDEFACTWVD